MVTTRLDSPTQDSRNIVWETSLKRSTFLGKQQNLCRFSATECASQSCTGIWSFLYFIQSTSAELKIFCKVSVYLLASRWPMLYSLILEMFTFSMTSVTRDYGCVQRTVLLYFLYFWVQSWRKLFSRIGISDQWWSLLILCNDLVLP